MKYDVEQLAKDVRARLGTGIKIHSVHDQTDNKWCVQTIPLASENHRNPYVREYGETLDQAINRLYHYMTSPESSHE